ncbi:MAG: 50S ribosomal protein L1 [Deltaproteobacteria bacterium]|nr:50S ribosomal protein L1 [Deltaproteobacteria bacterium]
MPKKLHGKKYLEAQKNIDSAKKYQIEEAFTLLEKVAFAKFDETVEVAFSLGVDPKHADQMVRGAIALPHGTGKTARVLVLAKGEKAKEAAAAGADFVGAEDLIEKITGGWMDFDKAIATPDMMGLTAKVAKILGPRGLMPNPKLGTVTFDVAKAVKEQKQGKIEYRTEKTGIVQVGIGKKSFGAVKLKENFSALLAVIVRAKPATSKGTYMKNITISATMSPGIAIDPGVANAKAE